jgi:uncharacterized protein YjbK
MASLSIYHIQSKIVNYMDCLQSMREEMEMGNVSSMLVLDSHILKDIKDYIVKVQNICLF